LEPPLEVQIGPLLRSSGIKLVLAESCTGGLVGHRITNVPGSSDYYLGSITAYAYEAKERLLGVNHDTLISYGAVSREVAIAMARGVRQALAPDFGIEYVMGVSLTGIAGPGGGTPTKPVGLVWIGLSTPSGDWAWSNIWPGNREQNKADSAEHALEIIRDYLTGKIK
jgi:PncC family amidohydrolase